LLSLALVQLIGPTELAIGVQAGTWHFIAA
jgi:hypothetical protein